VTLALKLSLLAWTAWAQPGLEVAVLRVLETQCVSCHGAAKMSSLDLRNRDSMLKGGARGPSVTPGDAAGSLLYRAVLRDGDLKMPPGRQGIPAKDVALIKKWIESGAKWTGGSVAAEPGWWSFRKPKRPPVPTTSYASRTRNAIDNFIFHKLEQKGLKPAAPASRTTLIRRATFDLHGLPPAPKEIDAFVNDPAPDAYEKLIDRLLASPRYGERWGRHWLDVVRYADTGGFETDAYFANAWRYRDYVIKSLNEDKPYHTFVREQIAADEIWPDNLDLDGTYELPKSKVANLEKWIGTSLYSLGAFPVEITFYGDQYRAEWQAEAVETTANAFLGLSMQCARCHDHKFDPITQRDFYSLSAIFSGSEEREVPIVSRMGIYEYTRHQTRMVMADQLKAKLQRLDAAARKRASPNGGERVEYTAAERDQRETLLRQIGDAYVKAPVPYAKANLLVHYAPVPETHVLVRGEYQHKGEKVRAGFPAVFGAPEIDDPGAGWFIPRRRKALAEWLTSPEHPLFSRVMVNRIWQGHFGRGIVATPNDFGRQGEPPSHPELLDWLAVEFDARSYSLKAMHRLIMLSEAYRFSSRPNAENAAKDPDNIHLWRMNRRRLEAEAIRDGVLAVSGALNLKMGGQPVVPALSREEFDGVRDLSQWPVTSDPAEHTRRSVYLFIKRSFRLPMMETFDAPDTSASCPRREASTVATQSLAMMNSEFMNDHATRFAARVRKEAGDQADAQVERAWQVALGRAPDPAEKKRAIEYLGKGDLPKLCLLLLNLSEFVYVD
jgi:hypothetical protein